jgi:hypothetical protein
MQFPDRTILKNNVAAGGILVEQRAALEGEGTKAPIGAAAGAEARVRASDSRDLTLAKTGGCLRAFGLRIFRA